MEEIWRDVVGFEGKYQVSNFGRVKSLRRVILERTGRNREIKERVLRFWSLPTGYHCVQLGCERKSRRYVHRLVLESFVGPCPDGAECCHNDGNPENNRLDNLRWDTKSKNENDKIAHGTDNRVGAPSGERNWKAKLTKEKVSEIRRSYANGKYLQRELAEMYGVGQDQISSIVRRETWRHVP